MFRELREGFIKEPVLVVLDLEKKNETIEIIYGSCMDCQNI